LYFRLLLYALLHLLKHPSSQIYNAQLQQSQRDQGVVASKKQSGMIKNDSDDYMLSDFQQGR
jgi:hypothetical protein